MSAISLAIASVVVAGGLFDPASAAPKSTIPHDCPKDNKPYVVGSTESSLDMLYWDWSTGEPSTFWSVDKAAFAGYIERGGGNTSTARLDACGINPIDKIAYCTFFFVSQKDDANKTEYARCDIVRVDKDGFAVVARASDTIYPLLMGTFDSEGTYWAWNGSSVLKLEAAHELDGWDPDNLPSEPLPEVVEVVDILDEGLLSLIRIFSTGLSWVHYQNKLFTMSGGESTQRLLVRDLSDPDLTPQSWAPKGFFNKFFGDKDVFPGTFSYNDGMFFANAEGVYRVDLLGDEEFSLNKVGLTPQRDRSINVTDSLNCPNANAPLEGEAGSSEAALKDFNERVAPATTLPLVIAAWIASA